MSFSKYVSKNEVGLLVLNNIDVDLFFSHNMQNIKFIWREEI